jgi:putative membrane protein insertion efficiency factor
MTDHSTQPTLATRGALGVLRAYQAASSGRVSPCRFYPSCSNYAVEAFTVHGFARGFSLTARRLVRCRPFGAHGVDLVPLRHDHHADCGSPLPVLGAE